MRAHRHERKAAPQPRQIVATQIDPFCAAGSAAPGRACGLRRRLAPRRRACLSYPRGILAGVSDADSDAHGSTGCPDVRQHLAELLASGEPSLDEVDWGRFRHAHGAAGDVPDLLRGLSARDQERASASLSTLWDCVCHQGGSSAPAALAVPFLLRAAADPAVHNRAQLLLLAAEAGTATIPAVAGAKTCCRRGTCRRRRPTTPRGTRPSGPCKRLATLSQPGVGRTAGPAYRAGRSTGGTMAAGRAVARWHRL